MKEKVIIVEEDQTVYTEEIEEFEIINLLDSGFVSAILRDVEEGIEYADVFRIDENDINPEIIWKIPCKKQE